MTTYLTKLGQLIEAFKNLRNTNFDTNSIVNEIKNTLKIVMNNEQIINYNSYENIMKKNNIDIDVLNNINGTLNLSYLKDWGPDNRYFDSEPISNITNDINNKLIMKVNNNDMLKIKRKRELTLKKNNRIGKISSNFQKYIRWKNINNNSNNNILNVLEEKVKKYREIYKVTKDKKDNVMYERLRKELQRTKNKIKEYNENYDNNHKITKYIYNYPYKQENKISSKKGTKSFLMPKIYNKTSKYIVKNHDFNNRILAKTDLKLVFNEIHSKIIKNVVNNDERKRLFNYLMNHFLKYFNMNYYGSQNEFQDIRDMDYNNKEINRNRTLTSFYNNLNNFIDDLLTKKQTYTKLEGNPIMRSLISGNDNYKICYVQFLKLMLLESNLAFSKIDNNKKLDKVRFDYYNNSFFVSSLKRKELLESFYNKTLLNDNDKLYLQKSLTTLSPFRLPNKNSVAILPNSDFSTNVMNIMNSNIMLQVVEQMSKDNKNISPIDIFYSYGIPINDITDDTKRKIGFNKKQAANALRELYTYQVAMIDSLRVNRKKTISKNITKKFSIYSNVKKDSNFKNIIISHPLNTTKSFLLPIPLEFVDVKCSDVFITKIINSYIRLFNLPVPGFINNNPDIGFEDYTIDEYLLYLKQNGFGSFLTHYLVNYLDEIKHLGGDFAFIRFIFVANMENGSNKHFSISFPFDLRKIKESLRITEQEIYERVKMELQIQLEFYDEDEGVFELYIVDIIIEFLTEDINNSFGLSAFGQKTKKKYNIKPIFESCFPDLNICLFECFFFLYQCKQLNLNTTNTKIEDIQIKLNIPNWIDYKSYLVNFLYSIDVIPELKEASIIGDVKGVISIMSSNYSIKIGVYNSFNNVIYPDDIFEDNEISEILVWSNFHVYLTSKIYLQKYLYKNKKKKVSKYIMESNKITSLSTNEFNGIILALDIETLTSTDGLIFGNQKPYLIQLWGGSDDLDYTFWGIDNCINRFVEWLPTLFEIDKEIYIFAHNGSKFDYKFLLSEFMNRYTVEIVGDHNKITMFKIRNIYFMDFFLFFPTSLNNLSKSWIGCEKIEFDHTKITLDNYNTEYKELAIEYCKMDCILLFRIVNKFLTTIFSTNFKNTINLPGSLNFYTAPQLALKIFKQIYLSYDLIGSIGWDYIIEKSSYYGGMCVVYRKKSENLNNFYGEKDNLYCYDINSCYPASMLKKMPYKFIDEIINCDEINEYIDYYLYEIDYEYPDNQIIVNLPTRIDGEIVYLKYGNKKWHWGNEINSSLSLGAKILKIHKIRRYEGLYIFKEYIEDIYNMRLEAKRNNNTCLVDFFKLLMNSLYGKLGQKLNLQKNIVSISELNEVVMYYNDNKIKNIKLLDGNCVEYEYEDLNEFYNQIGSLVRFSAFITAQARCILLKPFTDNILEQDNLFYTDTDSIFINKILPSNYVSNTELGKFKLEYEIKKAYFLAPKMYIVETLNGELNMKMKGIPKKQLKEEYFYKLLEDGYQKINYTSFMRYFSEIYVGEISKRIILKNYKRNYDELGNSIVWDNIDEFNNNKNRIIKMINLTYPSIQLIKTERKIIQSSVRKDNNLIGMKIELMIKNNYIMTYDDFFEYYQNDNSKKDIFQVWESINHIQEPEKYYLFLNKTFPLFMISRSKKKKTYATDEMVKEISLFLLEKDYSKENYYARISNFLLTCKDMKKHIVTLDKLKTNNNKSEILDYYNRIKQEHPEYSDYACMKKTLFNFCPLLIKGIDFKGKFKHVSSYYLDLMKFYFKYLLDNTI